MKEHKMYQGKELAKAVYVSQKLEESQRISKVNAGWQSKLWGIRREQNDQFYLAIEKVCREDIHTQLPWKRN